MAKNWHIRFFVTPKCNFACEYCNPQKKFSKIPELSTNECKKYLRAAISLGIKSVHWTGGEPLTRLDILELVSYSKKIGFEHQVITTNGLLLKQYAEPLFKKGLSRVNMSLDTLDERKFNKITGSNSLNKVLEGFEETLAISKLPTKLNVVVTKGNLSDVIKILRYALNLSNKIKYGLIVKLICVNPCNPVMLSRGGINYYKKEVVSYEELINKIVEVGDLKGISDDDVVGDNPNCKHFILGNKLKTSILSMPSWDHPCAGEKCKKLRISPFGELTSCLNLSLMPCRKLNEKEIAKKMVDLMKSKSEMDKKGVKRKHYSPDIGSVRFGKTSKPIDYSFFQNINERRGIK